MCCGHEATDSGFMCWECRVRVEFALHLYPAFAAYLNTSPSRVKGEPGGGGGYGSTVLISDAVQGLNVCDGMLATLLPDWGVTRWPYSRELATRTLDRLDRLVWDQGAVETLKRFEVEVSRLLAAYPTFERPRIVHVPCECGARVTVRTPPDKFGEPLLVVCPVCGVALGQDEYEQRLRDVLTVRPA